ncbi:36924_t:CDS:1, partial [Gigaspora margarita]
KKSSRGRLILIQNVSIVLSMHNLNLPTLSSDLIHQLAQLIQQSQTTSSPSQFSLTNLQTKPPNTEINYTGKLLA